MAARKALVLNAGRIEQLQSADTLVINPADLPTGNWIGAANGYATGAFTLNAANGTYQDTGVAVTLTVAGTYQVTARVRGTVSFSAGGPGFIVAKLYNFSDATDIADSETMVVYGATLNLVAVQTVMIRMPITVASTKVIKIYATRKGATTWTNSTVDTDLNGRTVCAYERVA